MNEGEAFHQVECNARVIQSNSGKVEVHPSVAPSKVVVARVRAS